MTLASKSKKWKIANLYEGVVERKHKLEIYHIEAKKLNKEGQQNQSLCKDRK